MLALLFRAGEGVMAALAAAGQVALLRIATEPPSNGANILADSLFHSQNGKVSAILFAAGSTIFAALFLRGRSIPRLLAWLGVIASALLVVVLPLEFAHVIGAAGWWVWMPMLAFEVSLGIWLLIKGVSTTS